MPNTSIFTHTPTMSMTGFIEAFGSRSIPIPLPNGETCVVVDILASFDKPCFTLTEILIHIYDIYVCAAVSWRNCNGSDLFETDRLFNYVKAFLYPHKFASPTVASQHLDRNLGISGIWAHSLTTGSVTIRDIVDRFGLC
jgi:hypothetical protein